MGLHSIMYFLWNGWRDGRMVVDGKRWWGWRVEGGVWRGWKRGGGKVIRMSLWEWYLLVRVASWWVCCFCGCWMDGDMFVCVFFSSCLLPLLKEPVFSHAEKHCKTTLFHSLAERFAKCKKMFCILMQKFGLKMFASMTMARLCNVLDPVSQKSC